MPLYEYKCEKCEVTVEVMQKLSDPPMEVCETCGGKVAKVFHPVNAVFKGGGFYCTDTKSASKGAVQKTESSSKTDDGGEASPCSGCENKGCPVSGKSDGEVA